VDLVLETGDEEEVGRGGMNSPSADSFSSKQEEKIIVNETFKLLPKKTREIVMAPFTSIQVRSRLPQVPRNKPPHPD
jgi:hypothetical protein